MNRTDWEEIRNQTCMQISYPGWNCRRPWHSFWNLNIGRTFIPARQSFRSSRVSWGWKGSRRGSVRNVENLCRSRLSRKWKIWFGECWLSQAPYPTEQWDGFGIGRRCRIVVRSITAAAVGLRVAREDEGEMDRGARESSDENSSPSTSPSSTPPITAR